MNAKGTAMTYNTGPMRAKLAKATPGRWYLGAQNDALFLVAGRSPATDNDYPWHDAPRVALAKMYGAEPGDCLPVAADANAALIVAAKNDLLAMLDTIDAQAAEIARLSEALKPLAIQTPT